MPSVTCIRDLGVLIDSKLTFKQHIAGIVTKAYTRCNLIFRSFHSHNVDSLLRAYCVYVRPLLEYASEVWSPRYVTYIDKLERVQRYFTRRLPGFDSLPYHERLSLLSLDRLELRRLKLDLSMYYRIMHNLCSLESDAFFQKADYTSTRATNSLKLKVPCSRINARSFFLSHRCVNVWNTLPPDTVTSSHLNGFKYRLKCNSDLSCFLLGRA